MIKAESLVKKFGDITALESLNTQIAASSIYGLVGPNGSGTSTFLRLISGVYYPDGGTVTVEDQPVYENTAIKDEIFFLSDDLYFPPRTTMDEMAAFFAITHSHFDKDKYAKLCKIFPLDAKGRIGNFSKGMRRQAALLLALCCSPRYLLLDEAFDGLDPVIRLMAKKLVADEMAERGVTVIVTSHNLRELEDLCDQIGLLHKGKILFQQEIDNLKLGFCKVQAAFGQPIDPAAFAVWGLSVMQHQQRGSLHSLLVRGSVEETLLKLNAHAPLFAEALPLTLEEVFIGEMEAVGYDYNNILF